MKPLPLHVRSLIHKRRALRDKRQAEQVVLEQLRDDLYHEQRFEASLAHAAKKQGEKVHRIFNPYYTEWGACTSPYYYTIAIIILTSGHVLKMARSNSGSTKSFRHTNVTLLASLDPIRRSCSQPSRRRGARKWRTKLVNASGNAAVRCSDAHFGDGVGARRRMCWRR